jgi:osmotically-inducible protein OsmY
MKGSKYIVFALMLVLTAGSLAFADTRQTGTTLRSDDEIVTDFTRALHAKVPNSSVFNSISVRSNNGNLVIDGKIRDAYLKDRATEAAEQIKGVQSVTNRIEILPASHFDDRLRVAIFRTLSRDGLLSRYFVGRFAGIHIIVENSRVTLIGEVSSNVERVRAASRVRGLFGVLGLDNQLTVHRS